MNRLLDVVGALILLSSVSANLVLMRENRNLAARAEAFRIQLAIPKGIPMPALRGVDLAGKPVVIDSKNPEHPTVLFVFSPTCASCAMNWPNWDLALAAQPKPNWRPVFVNMGAPTTDKFRHLHGLDRYTVLDDITKDAALAYRPFNTPETIVLNREGEVVGAWDGQLSQTVTSSLSQNLLDVR